MKKKQLNILTRKLLKEEISSEEFLAMVDGEFDKETLGLMVGVIQKRMGSLDDMLGAANPRNVVKGYKKNREIDEYGTGIHYKPQPKPKTDNNVRNLGETSFDEILDLRDEKADLQSRISRIHREMEDEGDESKGEYYGNKLNKLEARLYKIETLINDYDMNENTNEGIQGPGEMSSIHQEGRFSIVTYVPEGGGRATKAFASEEEAQEFMDGLYPDGGFPMAKESVGMNEQQADFKPRVVKSDKHSNFKTIQITYPTGGGATVALGKETGSGQERRKGATKAYMMGQDILDKYAAKYDLEDFEVSDGDNGVVTVFMVSDDFITENKSKFKKAGEASGFDMRGINEGASTEEKRIAMSAIKSISKLRGVSNGEARQDLIRAAKEIGNLNESTIEELEIGDKVKIDKNYGGGRGEIQDKIGSFVVVNGKSYHESDVEEILRELASLKAGEGYSPPLKGKENPTGKTKGLDSKTMSSILMKVIKDLDEAKKKRKDPVRVDTKDEREGSRQVGMQMTQQTHKDKSKYDRKDKHKASLYESIIKKVKEKAKNDSCSCGCNDCDK